MNDIGDKSTEMTRSVERDNAVFFICLSCRPSIYNSYKVGLDDHAFIVLVSIHATCLVSSVGNVGNISDV